MLTNIAMSTRPRPQPDLDKAAAQYLIRTAAKPTKLQNSLMKSKGCEGTVIFKYFSVELPLSQGADITLLSNWETSIAS